MQIAEIYTLLLTYMFNCGKIRTDVKQFSYSERRCEKLNYLQDLFNRIPCPDDRISAEKFKCFIECFQFTMSFDPTSLVSGCVNRSEFVVLYKALDYSLDNGENIAVAEAAKKHGVSVSFISKTLKSLEEKGYIERVSDKNDRRSVRISVTESGKEVVDRFFGSLFSLLDRATREFSKTEIENMIDFFKKFVLAAAEVKASDGAE